MKQIMFLIVIFGLIALSIAGYHHNPEFKAIKAKACDATTKITASQWTALLACGCNETKEKMAEFNTAVLANCSTAANEPQIQALKITGNAEQNKAVNEMCSENYMKCKMDYFKSAMKGHKKGDHKHGDGDDAKKQQFKEKMDKAMACMKTAVGITA